MRTISAMLLGAVVLGACGTGGTTRSGPSASGPGEPEAASTPFEPDAEMRAAAARADSVRRHYTDADVAFMRDMIHHHAQAIVMSRMAPSHGASEAVRTLAARIINAQRDEIATMQRWLRDRSEPVPVVKPDGTMGGVEGGRGGMDHGHTDHGDVDHGHMDHVAHGAADHSEMAGMLSPEQMARLRAARGEEWDRLFLKYMIQHHQGAVVMVDDLFSSPNGAQGDAVFRIASDINVDQQTEIDRMQQMLEELVFGTRTP